MRIAVFDYKIVATNPAGGCHLRMLRALAHEHQFTVFSTEFDNPAPDRIDWVRVPVPTRPLAVLFLAYRIAAPLLYLLYRWRTGTRFDLVQMVESNLGFGDISYSHFCHTAYLKDHWSGTTGSLLRHVLRWLDHKLHALAERATFKRSKRILVPSAGLGRELVREFPFVSTKVTVLPNAVDVERLMPDAAFDRNTFRRELGFSSEDAVFVFAALGHFERKGLPVLLTALAQLDTAHAKLAVVGGQPELIGEYRKQAEHLGIGSRVVFTGMKADVRPYFWAADAFVFPSAYETFSLVSYEAAAAGLPVIAPRLNGIDDLIRDGENGIVISRTVSGVLDGLRRFLQLPPAERVAMGCNARTVAASYNEANFCQRWRLFYQSWASQTRCSQTI